MNYRLLILDDGLGVVKLVRSILIDQPFEIIEGDKNQSPLTQAKKFQADLLMLDFNIGVDQDGYSLAKEIKKSLKDIKILLVFGTFDQPDNQKMNDALIDDYIYRPFDGEKLIKTCRSLVGLESTKIQIKINDGVKVVNQNDESKSKETLENELSQWEILVPEIIDPKANESDEFESFIVPGIMKSETTQEIKLQDQQRNERKLNYPSAAELAFPDEVTKTEQTAVMRSPGLPKNMENIEKIDEKTAVVDLAQLAAAQKDLLGKLKEQIQDEVETDFWSPEDSDTPSLVEKSKRTEIAQSNHQQNNSEPQTMFDKVEQQALKQEIMANVRDQILVDLKKEIMQELREEIITNLSEEDHDQLVADLKKNFIKEMKEKIYQDLFSKLLKELQQNLSQELKENLTDRGNEYLETKIREHFKKEAIPMLQKELPVYAQELIQNELLRIRRAMDGE